MPSLSRALLQSLVSKFACASPSSEGKHRSKRNEGEWPASARTTTLEQLPNELLLEIFSFLTLLDIYTRFYGLNMRLNQLIGFSCVRGYTVRSTEENNLYLKHILPDIPARQIRTLALWHNSAYDQLLNAFPANLVNVHTLVLKQLKNVSFLRCRDLLRQFGCLQVLSMVDFQTAEVDWLDDNNWQNLIDCDLPQLRHLVVRICVIYHKQMYDDDKDNIIYSFTSHYPRPTRRLYAGRLLKREPILEICLTIDRAFPFK